MAISTGALFTGIRLFVLIVARQNDRFKIFISAASSDGGYKNAELPYTGKSVSSLGQISFSSSLTSVFHKKRAPPGHPTPKKEETNLVIGADIY
jgi:hypothetical protein